MLSESKSKLHFHYTYNLPIEWIMSLDTDVARETVQFHTRLDSAIA